MAIGRNWSRKNSMQKNDVKLIQVCRKNKVDHSKHSPSALENLPVEVLELIFGHLSHEELGVIAMTTFKFAIIAKGVVWRKTAARFGTWAGERLYCVGEYLDPKSEVPYLNPEEWIRDRRQALENIAKVNDRALMVEDVTDITFGKVVGYTYHPSGLTCGREHSLSSRWHSFHVGCRKGYECEHRSKGECRELSLRQSYAEIGSFVPERSNGIHPDKYWVLLNLTTREYVRNEAIAMSPELIQGPHISPVGFGHLIFSKICFTSGEPPLYGSEWAGHRFKIVPFSKIVGWEKCAEGLIENKLGEPIIWRDISEKAWDDLGRNEVFREMMKEYLEEDDGIERPAWLVSPE